MAEEPEKEKEPEKDYILVGDKVSDNAQQALLFKPSDETVELGIIQKPIDGKPLEGDLVQLSDREGPGYEVDYVYKHPRTRSSSGPAKVNSEGYKSGWENIWGKEELN